MTGLRLIDIAANLGLMDLVRGAVPVISADQLATIFINVGLQRWRAFLDGPVRIAIGPGWASRQHESGSNGGETVAF